MYPDELQRLPLRLEKMFFELQDRIMSDVVRRLRKTGEVTSTADYQLIKVQILGSSTEFIESEIKRLTGMTDPEIWEVYDRVANKDYARMKSTYEQINSNFVPYEENDILQQWTEAVVRQTKGSLENITGSLGFTVDMGGGRTAFTPLSQYYQQYLDRACLDVVTGSFDYNTVLRRVVKEMTASGLQMVDYASGYHSRAPVAARRALMTGVHQLTAKMNEKIAKDLHTDYYEVTAHAGARPTHAVWQGRVYHYRDLGIVCGLGDVTGLCGANCRHSYYAFIPGVSVRTYTDEYLEDLRRKDAEIRTYHGKRYNGYEATQRQRQIETTMRAQRANIKQLKNGKADADIIRAAQTRYLTTLHEYQGFSKAMNLPEQMERVYMDGLGRMSGGRIPAKAFSESSKNAIIKNKRLYRKKNAVAAEPMPKKQLQKIVKAFRKRGGLIQMNAATDAYLDSKRAEAITYDAKTILLRQRPSRSAVFEELIHTAQFRQGKNDGSLEARLRCEIEAQEKLLKYQQSYRLTKNEIVQTQKALKAYEKELHEYLERRRQSGV